MGYFFGFKNSLIFLFFVNLSTLFLIHSSSDSRERAYDHSPYGHHERSGTFDRRHYNAEYYRDRSVFATAGPGSSAIGGSFEAADPHFDSRIRDPFTLTSSARRDLYRDDRGRRVDRAYHHRRSRSSHSSQSRHPSPQRTPGQTPKTPHSPKRPPLSPGRGPRSRSQSRSSSSDSVSSTSSTGSGRFASKKKCTWYILLSFNYLFLKQIFFLSLLFMKWQRLKQQLQRWFSSPLCSVLSCTRTSSAMFGDGLWRATEKLWDQSAKLASALHRLVLWESRPLKYSVGFEVNFLIVTQKWILFCFQ